MKKLTTAITRRDVLAGAAAFLSPPAIVRAAGLMPACGATMLIEGLPSASATQFEPRPQEGFVRRLMFNCCNNDLRAGRTESSFVINGKRLRPCKNVAEFCNDRAEQDFSRFFRF
jgi:hypothetical protein